MRKYTAVDKKLVSGGKYLLTGLLCTHPHLIHSFLQGLKLMGRCQRFQPDVRQDHLLLSELLLQLIHGLVLVAKVFANSAHPSIKMRNQSTTIRN